MLLALRFLGRSLAVNIVRNRNSKKFFSQGGNRTVDFANVITRKSKQRRIRRERANPDIILRDGDPHDTLIDPVRDSPG